MDSCTDPETLLFFFLGFSSQQGKSGIGFISVSSQAEMASLAAPFYFISQMLGEVGIQQKGNRKSEDA